MAELSMEQLDGKLNGIADSVTRLASVFETKNKLWEASTKKAMDEDKETAKKAKLAKYNAAIKAAMDEDDPDKKEAMLKAAIDDDKKDANHDDPTSHDKPDKTAKTAEEKEKDKNIATILDEKKASIIAQIMTANKIINPNGLTALEARIKTASITELTKEWNVIAPFVAGIPQVPENAPQTEQPIIPFFAGMVDTHKASSAIDDLALTASSPDSAFAKFSTQELLEMNN